MILPKHNTNTEYTLAILACLFTTSLIIAGIISEKYFLFIETPVSAKDIVYPLTFLFVNITAELYSLRQAKTLIMHGLYISIIVIFLLWVAKWLPVADNSPVHTEDFEKVLAPSLSLTIFSLGTYLIGQFFNLYLFAWFSKLLHEAPLWLRSALSSSSAQMVDTILLVIVAYLLSITLEDQLLLFNGIFSQYMFKVFLTFIGSLGVYFVFTLGHSKSIYKDH